MRHLPLSATLLLPFALWFSTTTAVAAKKTADTKDLSRTLTLSNTELSWVGSKKVGEKHTGTLKLQSGKVEVRNQEIVGGEIVIDLNSIEVTDIPKTSEYNAKLVGHLKSPDFFETEKFPTAKFVIKSAKKLSENEYEVNGDLTIKDVTKPHSMKVKINWGEKTVTAEGSTKIDRTQFGVKYGSANFFKLAADKIINNDFELSFKVTAE
jgi:polyisoprenoid-binding protein YceI